MKRQKTRMVQLDAPLPDGGTIADLIPTPTPALIEPQLRTLVEPPPSRDSWLYEIKYDGWRLLARKQRDDVHLYTRGGVEWSQRLPRLVEAVRGLSVASAWLDGEIVYLDDAGFPDFEQLQRDMRARVEWRLVFHVFDVSWLNGEELARRRLLDRKTFLREAITGSDPRIRFTDHTVADGNAVFARADSWISKASYQSEPTARITPAFGRATGRRRNAGARNHCRRWRSVRP